jgi:hypothetical protein
MAKDMDWLQYWRKLIVSSLTDAVVSNNHKSLDDILPTRLDYYIEAEFSIMHEARRVRDQVASGVGTLSSPTNDTPTNHTLLGRLLAHAAAQTAIEVKLGALSGSGKRGRRGKTSTKGKLKLSSSS